MRKIYVPYYDKVGDRAQQCWHPQGYQGSRLSQLRLDLDDPALLEWRHVDQITDQDLWIYELAWFYSGDLDPHSGCLEPLLSKPNLRQGLEQGRGKILVNLSAEGWFPDPAAWASFWSQQGIAQDSAVVLTGCSNAQAAWPTQGFFGRALFADRFMVQARHFAEDGDAGMPPRTEIVKPLLSFNRLPRLHRMQWISRLYQQALLDSAMISFARSVGSRDCWHLAQQHYDRDELSTEDLTAFAQIYPSLPLALDTDDFAPNLADCHQLSQVQELYRQTAVSVVTETLFHTDCCFISDKTWHPIRYLQPFILLGSPGTLARLQQQGYQTFAAWWDESYDQISDPDKRMSAVLKVCAEIASWSQQQLLDMLAQSRSACEHNLSCLLQSYDSHRYDQALAALFPAHRL